MSKTADEIEAFLATNPDKTSAVALAVQYQVPPSQRATRKQALESLARIARQDREHDTIARLASGRVKGEP